MIAAPPATARRRAVSGWATIVVALIAVGILVAVIVGQARWTARGPLDPESAGPEGTRALAAILRDHGITVTVARDRATAARLSAEPGATLVLPDDRTLSDDAFASLATGAADLVVIDARARGIRLLFPGARPAGVGANAAVAPACALPAAERAGPIVAGTVYAGGDARGCYPSGDGSALLARDDGRVVAVDGRALFVNAHLAENGNAALAVNLLGRTGTVVWFVPDLADSDIAGRPDLGDLTPPWVSPAIVLLIAAAAAAALWRGRRFGPLVVERLPVTVRANETTEGRARLYARSRDAAHAAEAIRDGALARMRRRLALPSRATAEEVAAAASARTRLPLPHVRGLLTGPAPTNDRGLVAFSDAIADIEAALDAASATEGTLP